MNPLAKLPALALLLGATLAHAEHRSASFRFLTFDRDDTEPLVARTGERVSTVERPASRFGLPVRLHGDQDSFALYPAEPPPATGTAKPPAPALRFNAAPGPRNLVLIFPSGGARVARAIPDDDRQFPFASTLVINLTNSAAAFTLADRRVALKPGEFRLIRPEMQAEQTEASVSLARFSDGVEKLLYGTVWILRKDCRQLVLLTENAEGACLVRAIADRRAEITEEAPPEKPAKPR